MSIEDDTSNRRAPEERNVYSISVNQYPQAPAERHVSEILAVRITREKADNALENVLTRLGLNGEGLQ